MCCTAPTATAFDLEIAQLFGYLHKEAAFSAAFWHKRTQPSPLQAKLQSRSEQQNFKLIVMYVYVQDLYVQDCT